MNTNFDDFTSCELFCSNPFCIRIFVRVKSIASYLHFVEGKTCKLRMIFRPIFISMTQIEAEKKTRITILWEPFKGFVRSNLKFRWVLMWHLIPVIGAKTNVYLCVNSMASTLFAIFPFIYIYMFESRHIHLQRLLPNSPYAPIYFISKNLK